MDGDELWESLRAPQVPKTLANHDQVKRVTYDGEPIPVRGAVLVGVTEFDSPEVGNLPTPLRDIQLLEERFRTFKVDHLTVLTSARKDKGSKPRFANIIRSIQEMRQKITSKGLLLVVISTHGFVSDGTLCLCPTDYDPFTRNNVLRIDDLSAVISPNRNDRGTLVVDYSSHWKETVRCFHGVDASLPVPLPPLRLGFSLMCSPPKLGGSFSAKFASMLDELISRQLPICANSIYAIFDKHALRWFGTPKQQMILMSDRAQTSPSGKIPLFNWKYVSQLDTRKVSYSVTIGMVLNALNAPVPDARSMCLALKHAAPHIKIRQIANEEQRRFIIKLSGGSPSRGPREDKIYYAREVASMCEEQGLPHVDVIKAWFGKLICVTNAKHFEQAFKGFQNSRLLKSSYTADPPPVIEYVGVLCRPEVTSPFSVHLALDEICRRHACDKQTGLYIEELNQIEDTTQDTETCDVSVRGGPQSRPLTPTSNWGAPPSPSEEGSPLLTKVMSQPWQQPTSTPASSVPVPVNVSPAPPPAPAPVPVPEPMHSLHSLPTDNCKEHIERLERELERERADREASMDAISHQLQQLQHACRANNTANLEHAIQQLQRDQHSLAMRLESFERSPPRSPNRGGAQIHVTNDEWMTYQDELKLLQVQLKNIQTSMPGGRESKFREGHDRHQLEALRNTCEELAFRLEAAASKNEVDKLFQQNSHHFAKYDESLKMLQTQLNDATRNMYAHAPVQKAVVADSPSAEDVRMLRQRVERIEGMGHNHSMARSPVRDALELKVDSLQSTVDRLLLSMHGMSKGDDVKKTYNEMMLEDIDAQLHGRMPSHDLRNGSYTPGAPVYLPSGLRSAIHNMVSSMISSAKEETEKWAQSLLNKHKDQQSMANATAQEQLSRMQQKIGIMELDRSHMSHMTIPSPERDGAIETHAQQLTANMSAINGLEQSLHMVQNTLTSHANRLQNAELNLDNHVTELQGGLADIRNRVDTTVQKVGQSLLEVDQKLMKDVTDAAARVTVAEQRIAHLDGRLAEDGDRLHRIEDRVDIATRQLQDRIDEQNHKLFETERKMTTSLDDKISVMRQIAEIAEKGTLDLEKKWHESEGQLKQQLRAALQQHIEGLEDVLQGMRSDVKGVEDKTDMMESIVGECRMSGNMMDQKMHSMERTVEALRNGFETYVHEGTVHIMQAQNEKIDDLRGKLGHELDTFDQRIRDIELQRRAADEELAQALEKIQVAVTSQPLDERVGRALAEMEETRIRPAMEAAAKSYELAREMQGMAQRIDGLTDQVVENSKETRAQAELQREKNIELSMLKDQVAHLKDMQRSGTTMPAAPAAPQGPSSESIRELENRMSDTERKVNEFIRIVENSNNNNHTSEISSIKEQITSIRDQMSSIRDQIRNVGSGSSNVVSVPQGADSGKVTELEIRVTETEKKILEQDQVTHDMVDTIEEHNSRIEGLQADFTSLRSKVGSMSGGGDVDQDFMQESLTKLKRDLADLKKEVDKLKGWKTGKEAESQLLERNTNAIREVKNTVSAIRDELDNMQAGL